MTGAHTFYGRTLSAREVDVLDLVASGMTNTEIGAKLYVTDNTVRSHLTRIREALGARNRAHAVAIGLATGQIQLPRLAAREDT